MEIPNPSTSIDQPSKVNEIYIVTDRQLEHYLDGLSLPESSLDGAGLIVDAGSGFSSFVEEVNAKFGATGTRAIGMDLIYARMAGTDGRLDKYYENGGRYSPGYGKLYKYASEEAQAPVYKAMYDEVTQSGNYVGGTYEAMPFQNGTVDLLVSHNAILNPSRSVKNLHALSEVKRVLKPDGEARFSPSYFGWDNDKNEVGMAVLQADIASPEQIAYQYQQVLIAFSELEKQGAVLWLAGREYDDGEKNVTDEQTLIVRFDNDQPVLEVEPEQIRSYEYFDEDDYEWKDVTYKQKLIRFSIKQTDTGFSIITETEN